MPVNPSNNPVISNQSNLALSFCGARLSNPSMSSPSIKTDLCFSNDRCRSNPLPCTGLLSKRLQTSAKILRVWPPSRIEHCAFSPHAHDSKIDSGFLDLQFCGFSTEDEQGPSSFEHNLSASVYSRDTLFGLLEIVKI